MFAGTKVNVDVEMPYNTMSIDEIKKLPVRKLADRNCEVYLWVTQKYLPDAFDILKAWSLKYCQTLTWCKNPMGTGQGGVYTPTTEFLILARNGRMPAVKRIDTTWFAFSRQRKHSKKPDGFQAMIEQVSEAPRLEMFARRQLFGWDVFGNEVADSINLDNYKTINEILK